MRLLKDKTYNDLQGRLLELYIDNQCKNVFIENCRQQIRDLKNIIKDRENKEFLYRMTKTKWSQKTGKTQSY